jgi:hypothetical protein
MEGAMRVSRAVEDPSPVLEPRRHEGVVGGVDRLACVGGVIAEVDMVAVDQGWKALTSSEADR